MLGAAAAEHDRDAHLACPLIAATLADPRSSPRPCGAGVATSSRARERGRGDRPRRLLPSACGSPAPPCTSTPPLGSVLGLLIVLAAFEGEVEDGAVAGLVALFIDGTDGMLARRFRVKETIPWFDGALLDNIVDYLTYVFAPIVLLWTDRLLPDGAGRLGRRRAAAAGVQLPVLPGRREDRPDHFFLGFPSYWNVVAFYAIVLDARDVVAVSLVVFAVLVFVPVRYLYPSRMRALRGADAGAQRGLAGHLRRAAAAVPRPAPRRRRGLPGLPRLLRRAEPLADGPRCARPAAAQREAGEGRRQVRDQVGGVLDAAGQPDEARARPRPRPTARGGRSCCARPPKLVAAVHSRRRRRAAAPRPPRRRSSADTTPLGRSICRGASA